MTTPYRSIQLTTQQLEALVLLLEDGAEIDGDTLVDIAEIAQAALQP